MKRKKVLVVAHDFPYPPNHGGRYDMFYRIKALHEMEFEIYGIFTVNENEEPTKMEIQELEKYVNRIFIKRRRKKILDLLKLEAYQTASRALLQSEIEVLIKKFNIPSHFEFILLEDFYVVSIFRQIMNAKLIKFKKLLYRIHNDNPKYFLELSKASPVSKKSYYLLEALKISFLEKKFIKEFKPIKLFISYDEFKKKKDEHSYWLPPAVNIEKLRLKCENFSNKALKIAFIGNLFTPTNIKGIKWFIEKVHPLLSQRFKNYELIIAGRSKNDNPLLEFVRNKEKIKIILNPLDLADIYSRSLIFINPVFWGAGVKLKNIDAIINGLPVISTNKGNEGTGLIPNKHLLIAESASEWIEKIEILYREKALRYRIVEKAQDFIKKKYNHIKVLKEILLKEGIYVKE